jgi:acid phosphatase type 7
VTRRLVLGVGLILGIVPSARGAGERELKKGPYLQFVTSTGVTVMFETEQPVSGTVSVTGAGEPDRIVQAEHGTLHEVRIDGLTPGRRYHYTVETDGQKIAGEIATAPRGNEPFSFVVFGDSRSNADSHRVLVSRVRREVPDFILGTGDMVNDGANERDWQTFFAIERDLLRDNVLYPSLGNHDRQGPGRRADAYRRYFAIPSDSPDPERYYAVTYANSRFLVLDSNSHSFSLTDQTAWIQRELERAVSDPAIEHIFVSMHHPPYSVSLHGGQPELREMWTPLFERYGVDAVFSGHDHCYSRSEKHGVRYFVSGGGGAPLYPRDTKPAREDVEASIYYERTFNYLRIQVVGDFVEVSAVRDDGSLVETVSWGKMPERRVAQAQTTAAVGAAVAAAQPGARARATRACAVTPGARVPSTILLLFLLCLLPRISKRS